MRDGVISFLVLIKRKQSQEVWVQEEPKNQSAIMKKDKTEQNTVVPI